MNYDELEQRKNKIIERVKNNKIVEIIEKTHNILNTVASNYDDDYVFQAVDDIEEEFLNIFEGE